MKSDQQNQRRLPNPQQIARDPETAICHALELHCELALRSLIAVHPELGGEEIPYWATSAAPSKSRQAACEIVALSINLQTAIEAYFRELGVDCTDDGSDFDDELPF